LQIGSNKEERQSEFMVFLDEFRLFDCNHKCLTECPIPGQDCYWDDPLIGMFDLVEYPEFFWWRFERIFGDSNEFLIITPDMMDEYFKEPEDPLQTRCPRCFSTQFIIGYPYMECKNCGYKEPLIDFPMSEDFYRFYEGGKWWEEQKGYPKNDRPLCIGEKEKKGAEKGTPFTSEACVETGKVL